MTTLFTWLGNADLKASEGDTKVYPGPILNALQARDFDRLVLLTDHGKKRSADYASWLTGERPIKVILKHVTLRTPTDYRDVYTAAHETVAAFLAQHPGEPIAFHLSPGTSAMASIWLLLAKTKFGAELIESSKEAGVITVDVPFELAAEYLPQVSRTADEALARLAASLPPESPEFSAIAHQCAPMKKVVAMAHRLALRDVPVLIQGESGTGKELFARAIHRASARRDGPFKAVNCGAIPTELVESELFGHKKGSFTGAVADRAGYFEAANGGTLFLDEIGELPLPAQVRLLRVLQESQVTRIGETEPRPIDVRVVAATNRVMPAEVRDGRFREDLFHRLAVGVLVLPPLRERPGDIGLLIDTLLAAINTQTRGQPGHKDKKLSAGARNILVRQGWPGNVRELHNVLLRASIWAAGDTISADDVTEALSVTVQPATERVLDQPLDGDFSIATTMGYVARHYLERAMEQAKGNKTEAARLLGLGSYQTLTNWLQKYEIE